MTIPLHGGKDSKAKHFSLYHQVQCVDHDDLGAFLRLNEREQFQLGPYTFLPLEKLIQIKKV